MLMRHGLLYGACLLFLGGLPISAGAQYTPETASTLPVNGSSSGSMDGEHANYWWKVTIPGDGALTVTTLSVTELEIDNYLYDQNGTTQLAGYDYGGRHIDDRTHCNNLKQGTYYIRSARYEGVGSYTIQSSFIPATLTNDPESNDSSAVATALEANSSRTGRLGFYGNGETDLADWYRITIPDDGALLVKTFADSTLEIDNYLYDQDGKTQLAGYDYGGAHITDQTRVNNLKAGTYYIRTLDYSGYGSYSITSVFTPASLATDPEPNDSAAVSITLAPDGSDTGRLGYFTLGKTDTEDWWKITIPSDGSLLVKTLSDSTIEIDNYLYDQDGKAQLAGYDYGGSHLTDQTHVSNLKAGTYYIRTLDYGGYGSYAITGVFTPTRYANDTESNDTRETAASGPVQATGTGHLGFYTLGSTDTADWRSFTVPSGWDSLFVLVVADSTLEADANLHDAEGNQIDHDGRWGVISGFSRAAPAGGTYFMNLYRYSGYGSYRFIVTNHWLADVPAPSSGELSPPSQVVVSDVPDDNGHQLRLSWTLSPSESDGEVLRYRIFRSRSTTMTAPEPRSRFTTLENLNIFEATGVILADSVAAGTSQYTDFVPLNGVPYYYWVQAVGPDGVSKPAASAPLITSVREVPWEFRVAAPYPNPFNPSVTIGYTLPERMQVRLTIYDSLGRVVSVLENRQMDAGNHETIWNGRSGRGETLGSGIYLYRVEAGSHRVQGKMTLLR